MGDLLLKKDFGESAIQEIYKYTTATVSIKYRLIDTVILIFIDATTIKKRSKVQLVRYDDLHFTAIGLLKNTYTKL